MNVAVINRTVRTMCIEIDAQSHAPDDWRLLSEEHLFYETAVCISASQMIFEMAVATVDHLRAVGLTRPHRSLDRTDYERRIVAALSEPVSFVGQNGSRCLSRPRFKHRLAALLANTVSRIYEDALSIRGLLLASGSSKMAREVLIDHICGFGPKQASLFLRRIGFCEDLAVLDVHVLDYLALAQGIRLMPSRLARLSSYERIEDAFREIAVGFGYSLGCVDLATWLTMRVAKREAFL